MGYIAQFRVMNAEHLFLEFKMLSRLNLLPILYTTQRLIDMKTLRLF